MHSGFKLSGDLPEVYGKFAAILFHVLQSQTTSVLTEAAVSAALALTAGGWAKQLVGSYKFDGAFS